MLNKTPEEVIADVRESDSPKHKADEIARKLLTAHGPRQDAFWYRTELNLLALILLYVAKAKAYTPIEKADAESPDFTDYSKRQAADIVNLICSDPREVSQLIRGAIDRTQEDSQLLKHHYSAWRCSPNWESIYCNLANEVNVREFFDREAEV